MGGCVLKIKIQTCRGGVRFRNFEMPWTTFHAFSWWRRRERQCRAATRDGKFTFLNKIILLTSNSTVSSVEIHCTPNVEIDRIPIAIYSA